MKSNLTISVIITTFNRKDLVKRAINSVLEQTILADEIIIIDDGSDDGTEEYIKEYFPDIKYYWQKNTGISAARNKGIAISINDWIAFLDSDDEWLPKKLEKQKEAILENPSYQLCHTNEIWIRNGRRVNPKNRHQKFGGLIFEKCLPLCVISPSSVIIHREVFQTYGKFDESLPVCEDYDMWLRLCAFLPVLYLEDMLVKKYGGHQDQLSKKLWGMDRFRIKALEKIINNSNINPKFVDTALETLREKIDIVLQGAHKRHNLKEISIFEQKKKEYKSIITSSV